MNDIIKVIYERRSVRRYKDIPVETEVIEQLLDAARMAPSAINKQPWKFHVLTNAEKMKTLSKEISSIASQEMKHMGVKEILKMTLSLFHFSNVMNFVLGSDPIFHGAPVAIFVTAPKEDEWAALDIGMCSQNIMLAAKSMGLDTCPVGFAKMVMQVDNYPLLNIPPSEEVHLAIIVGYGDEQPKVHERIKDNAFFID